MTEAKNYTIKLQLLDSPKKYLKVGVNRRLFKVAYKLLTFYNYFQLEDLLHNYTVESDAISKSYVTLKNNGKTRIIFTLKTTKYRI